MRATKLRALVLGTTAAAVFGPLFSGPVRAASPPAVPAPAPAPAPAPVSVRVSRTEVGRPVPPGFVGLSFEFRAVREYTGSDPRAINPVLVRLIRNLAPGQAPVLRIGGNSTDETWWPTPRLAPSPGIKYTLTPSWLATTRMLAVKTGGRLILGLNLKLDSATEMAAEARAYRTGIGRRYIEAFEIGNEPELYPITPFYYGHSGSVPVYPRPRSYGFSAYAQDVSALAGHLPATALAGPATGNLSWLARFPALFTSEPRLRIVTYHRYPLIKCFTKPGDSGYPTIPNLLKPAAARDLLKGAAPYIALAHAHGAVFRVDELNSVACKGQAGVSDTFASALWLLDTMFAMAGSGVDGVNIHTLPEAVYRPFVFRRAGGRWLATVQPEYYGLLMFAQAAPPGSRLLDVSSSGGADVRVRATLTPAGQIHVVLINDSLTADHTVLVRAPAGAGKVGRLERLRAPSAAATDGVTLGGQSFGTETATGELAGAARTARLTPVRGQYVVSLPASSAAMLTIGPAGG